MKLSRARCVAFLFLPLLLIACGEATPTETILNPIPLEQQTPNVPAAIGANETPFPDTETQAPLPVAKETYCKNGGEIIVNASEPLAVKVNGQGIPLALYQRLAQQEQAAMIAQGLDPKTQNGQEALKAVQQQTLGQLIDDVLLEQAARQEHLTVGQQDVDNRIQQMIDEAGGRPKFDDYLKTSQNTIDDLCIQIRAAVYGEQLMARVTASVPTKVEQVHAAHILLASQADADKVVAELKAKKDFAALAKQYSKDEVTRDNGGDLGWLPRGIMPPEFETVAFQLQPGQISGVVNTPLGFHIIKVIERAASRELSSEMLQNQKQQAFLAWLDAQRNQAKIEKYVNP